MVVDDDDEQTTDRRRTGQGGSDEEALEMEKKIQRSSVGRYLIQSKISLKFCMGF